MTRIPVHLIRSEKQLAVLAAAARQEVFDVLDQMGTASIAELAAVLGRPADALYFHVRSLVRAGLVRQARYRVRSGRKEAIFQTLWPKVKIQYEPRNAANRKAVSAIVASMMRLTMRDFRRSFERGHVAVSGAHRELWALRTVGRLSRMNLRNVNRSIGRLVQDVTAPRAAGRLYAVTVILTPLDHRNKGSERVKGRVKAKREDAVTKL